MINKSKIKDNQSLISIVLVGLFTLTNWIIPLVTDSILFTSTYDYLWDGKVSYIMRGTPLPKSPFFIYRANITMEYYLFMNLFAIAKYLVPVFTLLILGYLFYCFFERRQIVTGRKLITLLDVVLIGMTSGYYIFYYSLFYLLNPKYYQHVTNFTAPPGINMMTLSLFSFGWIALILDIKLFSPISFRQFLSNIRHSNQATKSIVFITAFFMLDFLLPLLKIFDIAHTYIVYYWDGSSTRTVLPSSITNFYPFIDSSFPKSFESMANLFLLWILVCTLLIPFLVLLLLVDPVSENLNVPKRLAFSINNNINPKIFYYIIFGILIVLSISHYIFYLILLITEPVNEYKIPLSLNLMTAFFMVFGWVLLFIGFIIYYNTKKLEEQIS